MTYILKTEGHTKLDLMAFIHHFMGKYIKTL